VQGQLRNEPITFTISTSCAHCGKAINIEMDGKMSYRVVESDAEPLVFVPMVNFSTLEDPSIIDAF
jgi:hypothetical protein